MALYNGGFPIGYQPMVTTGMYQQQPYLQQAQMFPQQQQAQLQVSPVQVQAPSPAPVAQGNSSIIWVQGEAGAKSYIVPPGGTVQLWDSERQTIYIKSADASGMPSTKVLDYTIRDVGGASAPVQAQMQQQANDYAMREDLEQLKAQIDSLRAELDGVVNRQENFRRKREERENGKSAV